jgi:hypothetical protein
MNSNTVSSNGHVRRRKADIKACRTKPPFVEIDLEGIPAEIRPLKRFVCWRWTWDADKGIWDKPPINPQTGRGAKSTDPGTWVSLEEAIAYVMSGKADGIGFCLGDGWAGIDLDDCIDPDTEEVDPWATAIVDRLNTYTDQSPSDTGCKMLVKGKLPPGRRKMGDVEFYDQARYFTLTGRRIPGTPAEPRECQAELEQLHAEEAAKYESAKYESAKQKGRGTFTGKASERPQSSADVDDGTILAKMFASKNGADIKRLWEGDTGAYSSHSEADLALCNHLAFWCGPDHDRIAGLFAQSGLNRGKWDRQDYRKRTIEIALEDRTEFYDWARGGHGGEKGASGSDAKGRAHPEFELGPLRLRLSGARKTASGKLVGTVLVMRDGVGIDQLTVTSAGSGRMAAAKTLALHLPNDAALLASIEMALGRILVAAEALASRPMGEEGVTVRQVVQAKVMEIIQPAYKTALGIYSKTRAVELRRNEFVVETPTELVDAAEAATDCPREEGGRVNRLSLIKRIQAEMGVLWSDLRSSLPQAADSMLTADSPAARQFLAAVLRMWRTTGTWEKTRDGHTEKTSLVARARHAVLSHKKSTFNTNDVRKLGTRRWVRVLNDSVPAWWRVEVTPEGEIRTYLAMREDVGDAMRVPWPDGMRLDHREMVRLGKQYGVFEENPVVPTRNSGGEDRIAVLSRQLTDELLNSDEEALEEVQRPAEAPSPEPGEDDFGD